MVLYQEIISIHPTSLLGISDSYNRSKFRNGGDDGVDGDRLLIGGLIGKNNLISHSFDLIVNENGIDKEFLELKLQQLKIIYPNQTLIGFYQISDNNKLEVNNLALELLSILNFPNNNDDFIYMMINPTGEELPIKIISLSNQHIQLMYNIDSTPSEKSSLNSIHESVLKTKFEKPSEIFITQTETLKKNLKNLDNKISKIIYYLNDDELGKLDVPKNDELLMQIDKFVFAIEMIQSDESFTKELDSQKLELLMTVATNLMVMIKHE